MKKLIGVVVLFCLPLSALAFTQPQIDSIVGLLQAFNVDSKIILSVESDLQGITVVETTPVSVSTTTFQLAPSILSPVSPSFSSPQFIGSAIPVSSAPTCTLTTGTTTIQSSGSNTTYITWTTTNASSANYYVSGGNNQGDKLVWIGPIPLTPLEGGTQYNIDTEYDKLVVNGNGQTNTCTTTMSYADPLDPSLKWN